MSSSSKRVTVKHDTEWDDARDTIHQTMGCADVARKPELAYELSTTAAKVAALDLVCEEDWEGCLSDVTVVESKKGADSGISVTIVVSEQVRVVCSFIPGA
jgi:hypothetical protein